MAKEKSCDLVPDRRGAIWDALMYVPTVIALASIGLKLWFGGGEKQGWAYLLFFGASFFFIAGVNRIFSSRLLLFPSSPLRLEVGRQQVVVVLKRGERVELVKELRYFPDYAGKSFALTGMDLAGRKRQFVFHKGQFPAEQDFQDFRSILSVYK